MDALFARLSHYCEITDAEFDALKALSISERTFNSGQDIIKKGETPDEVLIVKAGWAARYISLPDGRSQIVNFMLPGDMYDLQAFLVEESDHSIVAITKVSLFAISRRNFIQIFSQPNKLGLAFWWATLQEEAILREQVVRNGRRNAQERVAHLLLELHRRTIVIGEGDSKEFRLPVSQVLIADAVGLSFVHVSRVLGKFVKDGMIEKKKDLVIITDRDALIELCDFSPSYLHLDERPPRYWLQTSQFEKNA